VIVAGGDLLCFVVCHWLSEYPRAGGLYIVLRYVYRTSATVSANVEARQHSGKLSGAHSVSSGY